MTLAAALTLAALCGTPTSWAERAASDVWVPVCGDSAGNERPSCAESAELAWHISGGQDAAWENAYADCASDPAE